MFLCNLILLCDRPMNIGFIILSSYCFPTYIKKVLFHQKLLQHRQTFKMHYISLIFICICMILISTILEGFSQDSEFCLTHLSGPGAKQKCTTHCNRKKCSTGDCVMNTCACFGCDERVSIFNTYYLFQIDTMNLQNRYDKDEVTMDFCENLNTFCSFQLRFDVFNTNNLYSHSFSFIYLFITVINNE